MCSLRNCCKRLRAASGSFSLKLLKIKVTDPASAVRLRKLLRGWNIRILDTSMPGVFCFHPQAFVINHPTKSGRERVENYRTRYEQRMTQLTAHDPKIPSKDNKDRKVIISPGNAVAQRTKHKKQAMIYASNLAIVNRNLYLFSTQTSFIAMKRNLKHLYWLISHQDWEQNIY